MNLNKILAQVSRPLAATGLVLVAVGVARALQDRTPNMDTYATLFWASVVGASLMLLLPLVHPRGDRSRVTGFGTSAILAAVVFGNGLTSGAARTSFGAVVLVCVLAAVPALVVQLEKAQVEPVSRL